MKCEEWKQYKIRLEIISPIIINTGDVYNFGEITFDGKTQSFCQVDLMKAASYMSKSEIDKYVSEISQRGVSYYNSQVLQIIDRIIAIHPEVINRRINILPKAQEAFEKSPSLQISKIIQDQLTGNPYIPGSSIKGALRTAMLQALNGNDPPIPPENPKEVKNYEAKLFNRKSSKFNVSEDPFKYVKVSDFIFEKDSQSINIGMASEKPTSIFSAMTDSPLFYKTSKVISAKGVISISSRIEEERNSDFFEFNDIRTLLYQSRLFYSNTFKKGTSNRLKNHISTINTIIKFINYHNDVKKGYLLRVGHYSGIENVTLNVKQSMLANKKIKNPLVNIEGGVTAHLIEGMYPAGYCALYVED